MVINSDGSMLGKAWKYPSAYSMWNISKKGLYYVISLKSLIVPLKKVSAQRSEQAEGSVTLTL